jgi:hypothetical protein
MSHDDPESHAPGYLGALVQAGQRGGGRELPAEWEWLAAGVRQRARVERVASDDRSTDLRLSVSTSVLDGFTGAPGQLALLSERLAPSTLAGLVRSSDVATRLDLASAWHASRDDVGWLTPVMTAAALAQAEEAASFVADRDALVRVGLAPALDAEAGAGAAPAAATSSGTALAPVSEGAGWTPADLAACLKTLRSLGSVRAIDTPWGISGTIWPGGPAKASSILEVRAGVERPRLGKGLSIVLRTAIRGGPLRAIAWNEREVSAEGRGDGLGGWWAPEGGFLVHASFYPDSLREEGRELRLLLTYLLRSTDVHAVPGVFE